MISVCMAVKDGARFLSAQLESILPQLSDHDEIIISDDHSSDHTYRIVSSFNDPRIKFLKNPQRGLLSNFENALRASTGEIIFLADQDDIWMPDKIKKTVPLLIDYDLVLSDCLIADAELNTLHESFFKYNRSSKGFFRNLFRNSYMGCCMAFRKTLLTKALPFPSRLIVHDQWLGLIGELYGNVFFHTEKLVLHRRHDNNASTTFYKSKYDVLSKFSNRLNVAVSLIENQYGN